MYLKKLELKGFKSFYNKTDINFEKGITSIVGPNGSGKSNISDSVRWVLGEQSIKSLRGDKLEDVIFAGTDDKKPMAYCEASITIDNSEHIIDIDYIEVNIKRRVYRSGESQFFINDKPCRLRDIKELIMDTGIGKEGYSIIEQGKIDEILSGSPINRKRVFEEAAGIAKYRYKKEDGERKLKTTIENLERINDIYIEIESQVEPLKKQSGKAQKYKQLKEELKKNEINKYIKDVDGLNENIKTLSVNTNQLQEDIDQIEIQKKVIGDFLEHLEKEAEDSQILLDEYKNKTYNLKSQFEGRVNESNILQLKINNINENKEVAKKYIDENIEKIKKIEIDTSSVEEKIRTIESKLNDLQNSKKEIELNSNLQRDLLDKEESYIESLKNKIVDIVDDRNKKNIKLSTYIERLENINKRKQSIEDEIHLNNNQLDKNSENELELSVAIKSLIEEENKLEESNLSKKKTMKDELQNKSLKEKELNELNIKISKETSKLNIYIEMENQYEGFNKGVKEVLKNKELNGIKGVVGSLIKVDKEYENAIEIGLGSSLQNIVTNDEYTAKQAIEYLKRNSLGRVTFLPINIIKGRKIEQKELPQIQGILGIASDIVEFEPIYKGIFENLLGRIIIVRDVDVAIELAKKTSYRYKIVTLEGEVFNAGGSLTGGTTKNLRSILSRKRIINEIEDELERIKNNLNLKHKEINDISSKIEQLENDIEVNIEKIRILGKDKSSKETIMISLIKENDGIKKTIEKLDMESKSINDGALKSKQLIDEVEEQIKTQIEEINELENLIRHKNTSKNDLLLCFNDCMKNLNSIEIEISRSNEEFKNLIKDKKRLDEENFEIKSLEEEKKENIKNFEAEIESIKMRLEEYKLEKSELELAIKDCEENIENIEGNKKDIQEKLHIEKEKQQFKNEEFILKREEFLKLDNKRERYKSSLDDILEKVWQDYEISYQEMLELKDQNINTTQKIINSIKDQIKNLGNVNLDSIEEYENIKSRYEFYKEQKKDLEGSVESLKELISTMEYSMKVEFKENFKMINENFKVVFKKLFGGGLGELRITDSNNILESDIEIVAQPPGKKLKTINLMSGGEKALTAIAILFSILISKPTPFCILDEIEAPLDDANIYRFGEFLKELSKDTQFISITHRRGTMEASDYIYGITMEEKGVSKVIGLKLEEAKDYVD